MSRVTSTTYRSETANTRTCAWCGEARTDRHSSVNCPTCYAAGAPIPTFETQLCATCGRRAFPTSYIDSHGNPSSHCRPCRVAHVRRNRRQPP